MILPDLSLVITPICNISNVNRTVWYLVHSIILFSSELFVLDSLDIATR